MKSRRQRELASIHLMAKRLGMDRDVYENMLWSIGRVRSAADLDAAGRARVMDHLRARGGGRPEYPGRPHNMNTADKGPLLRKLEALLADSGRPWSYADAIAKHSFGVDRVAFLRPDQLHKLVSMLMIDQRRRAGKTDCPKA